MPYGDYVEFLSYFGGIVWLNAEYRGENRWTIKGRIEDQEYLTLFC